MKNKNPCDFFRFFSKQKPDKPVQIKPQEISYMLPATFEVCIDLLYRTNILIFRAK